MVAKRYSKDEFRAQTHKQRDEVIKIDRDALKVANADSKNTPGISGVSVNNLRQQFQSNIVTLGDAIVAGLAAAQKEDDSFIDNEMPSVVGTESSSASVSSKRSRTTSGGVSDLLRKKQSRN